MNQRPTLTTRRLLLRPFVLADARDVQRLAGDREVTSTTLNIPYPYQDGAAEQWISTHQEEFDKGNLVNFAIVLASDGSLIGAMGLRIDKTHSKAELGYWIGKPFWNRGFCTEAAGVVVEYAFKVLALNKIHATHLTRNPASGRVLQKLGMTHEGSRRQHVRKWDVFEDVEEYGILKRDYESQRK